MKLVFQLFVVYFFSFFYIAFVFYVLFILYRMYFVVVNCCATEHYKQKLMTLVNFEITSHKQRTNQVWVCLCCTREMDGQVRKSTKERKTFKLDFKWYSNKEKRIKQNNYLIKTNKNYQQQKILQKHIQNT